MHVTVTCKAASIGNIEREMRVAMVGSGLSGLVAAHELARSGGVRVTVYEKEDHLGGAKTVAVASSTSAPWSSTRCGTCMHVHIYARKPLATMHIMLSFGLIS
jgi:glycine/D-amino acid oxidase-like deaminating enzyme